VEKNDERFQEAELHRLQGELLLVESADQTAAEECFRRAVETARRQQSKAWELRVMTSLARLWQNQGRREEAFRALSTVRGVFAECFTMPDLVDAGALLENLGDERTRAEFAPGIKYVRDCIPPPMDGLVSVDWRYLPTSTLGGDTIGYHWVDDGHLTLYLIDVTGHGLDAALLSVSLANVIRASALPEADMRQPDQVLAKLNDAFQGEHHGERFFTNLVWCLPLREPHDDLVRRRSSALHCFAFGRAESAPSSFRRLDNGRPSWCRFSSSVVPNPCRSAPADLQRWRL
jgi:Stage II sporulation protein E (SpoIIE)